MEPSTREQVPHLVPDSVPPAVTAKAEVGGELRSGPHIPTVTRQKPPRGRERPRFARCFAGRNLCGLRGRSRPRVPCAQDISGFSPRLALTKPWYRILTNSWSEPGAVFKRARGRLQLVENSRIIIRLCPSYAETTPCAGIGSSN